MKNIQWYAVKFCLPLGGKITQCEECPFGRYKIVEEKRSVICTAVWKETSENRKSRPSFCPLKALKEKR